MYPIEISEGSIYGIGSPTFKVEMTTGSGKAHGTCNAAVAHQLVSDGAAGLTHDEIDAFVVKEAATLKNRSFLDATTTRIPSPV